MTGISANLRRSFRDLTEDLERAGADLVVAIGRVIPGADIDDFVIREEGEPAIFKTGALRQFLDDLDRVSAEIDSLAIDFNWRIREAIKTFKQQVLASETTS